MTFIAKTITTALAAILLATATSAAALTPLRDEVHINNSLISAKIADRIRKVCPSISPRYFVVLGKVNALKAYARKKGYSEPEVRAFLKDPLEKARVGDLAQIYMKNHGVVAGDTESYCRLGREEIVKKSLIGQMLRAH